MRKIWHKIIKLININNAEDFVKYTLDGGNSEYTEADVIENINYEKSNCVKDKIITVLDSAVDDIFKA